MGGKATRFKKEPELPRSSGLRLSEPIRAVIEGIAAREGTTYSDTLRRLIEEALAARAGQISKTNERLDMTRDGIDATLLVLSERVSKAADRVVNNLREQNQALSTIEQQALCRLDDRLDVMQWQVEKVLDSLAGLEARG